MVKFLSHKEMIKRSLVPSWLEDDNFVRFYDPNMGKGKELYEYLESVNEEGPGSESLVKRSLLKDFITNPFIKKIPISILKIK